MWDKIRRFLAPPVFADDEDKTRVAKLLNTLVMGIIAVLSASIVTGLIFAKTSSELNTLMSILGLLFLMIVISKVLLQLGRLQVASIICIVGLWLTFSLVHVLSAGRSHVVVFFAGLVVVAGLLMGPRASIIAIVMSALTGLGVFVADSLDIQIPVAFPGALLPNLSLLVLALIFLSIPLLLTLRDLTRSVNQAHALAAEANRQRERLVVLAQEREQELIRRASYLGATTEIASEAASVEHDPQRMLARITQVVSTRFGFYHTGLFLLDASGEWAVLEAASSEGGRRMLERGHRLRVGPIGVGQGIVGSVAHSGEHRVALDVGEDVAFFDNPDLPDTHSEIALALRVRNEIIGVLDVQSVERGAFSAEDVSVLQALADQVAVAISNAQLFHQAEERTSAELRLYGERAREAWQEMLRVRPDLAFASDAGGVSLFDAWEPQMKQAAQTGQVVLSGESPDVLALPIRVRDQVIGVIDGRKADGAQWTQGEVDLLQTLTEQLGTALEGAQLYEATQRRAAREQLTREITDRMRAAIDWDELMQTAMHEMAAALGAARAFVQWVPGSEER